MTWDIVIRHRSALFVLGMRDRLGDEVSVETWWCSFTMRHLPLVALQVRFLILARGGVDELTRLPEFWSLDFPEFVIVW